MEFLPTRTKDQRSEGLLAETRQRVVAVVVGVEPVEVEVPLTAIPVEEGNDRVTAAALPDRPGEDDELAAARLRDEVLVLQQELRVLLAPVGFEVTAGPNDELFATDPALVLLEEENVDEVGDGVERELGVTAPVLEQLPVVLLAHVTLEDGDTGETTEHSVQLLLEGLTILHCRDDPLRVQSADAFGQGANNSRGNLGKLS